MGTCEGHFLTIYKPHYYAINRVVKNKRIIIEGV